MRKSNVFSVFAVYVTQQFNAYYDNFCAEKGDKIKAKLASILLNRRAVLKTENDSPCRLVHSFGTACLFIRIVVAYVVLPLY